MSEPCAASGIPVLEERPGLVDSASIPDGRVTARAPAVKDEREVEFGLLGKAECGFCLACIVLEIPVRRYLTARSGVK